MYSAALISPALSVPLSRLMYMWPLSVRVPPPRSVAVSSRLLMLSCCGTLARMHCTTCAAGSCAWAAPASSRAATNQRCLMTVSLARSCEQDDGSFDAPACGERTDDIRGHQRRPGEGRQRH